MARMRTLKPEFWSSPSTAEADLAVRLTFMAMWNWADDSGHGTANLKELEAFAFPNDEVAELPRRKRGNSAGACGGWRNFAELCGEVAEAYGVVFYRVKNRPYYWIVNFKDHQSKDFRPESRYPQVEEGEIYDVTSGNTISPVDEKHVVSEQSAGMRGNSAGSAGDSGLVIGEKGNRGIGEKGNRSPADAEAEAKTTAYPQAFEDFWNVYPKKADKRAALKAWNAATKRAGKGAIEAGAEAYRDDPNRQDSFTKNPATWLNADSWNNGPLPDRNEPQPWSNKATQRQQEQMQVIANLAEYDNHDRRELG